MGRSSIISATTSPYSHRTADSSGYCHGPRRVICFCFLAIIAPSVFIAVPILMRFVVYGSASYHVSPSDMRLVDEKISTTWCKKQTLKANITFTAYDSNGIPQLAKSAETLNFRKTLIIPDDYKEYWGFYLLQGSQYRISACARFKGGTLLIVKGRQHLDYCAYIGNTDSAQDSDEFSDSKSNERNPSDPDFSSTSRSPKNRVKINPTVLPSSQEEMSILLSKIRSYIKQKPHRYTKLKNKLLDWSLAMNSIESKEKPEPGSVPDQELENFATDSPAEITSPQTDCNNCSIKSEEHRHKIRHEKSRNLVGVENDKRPEYGKISRRKRHDVQVQKISDSGENGAFEDLRNDHLNELLPKAMKDQENLKDQIQKKNTPDSIWKTQHSLHSGVFNTSVVNDGSNSESESSYSSSEEALAKCEGIVALFYLKPSPDCGIQNDTFEIPILFNSTVDTSGYYYFIVGSENEKTDNIMQVKFDLEKYEYELPEPLPNCTNVRQCELDLRFGSNQKMVISVPQPSPNREEIWDENYIAESECDPRAGLYLIFVICLPVMILLCAFQ